MSLRLIPDDRCMDDNFTGMKSFMVMTLRELEIV